MLAAIVGENVRRLRGLVLAGAISGAGVFGAPVTTEWKLDQLPRVGEAVAEVWGAPRIGEEGIVFDGGQDGLLVPLNPLAGWGQFTVEILFCPSEGGGEAQRFFHAQDEQGKGMRVMVETRLDGRGGWWLDTFLRTDGESRTLIDPRRVHPTGKWFWVALRYDGQTMAHFVNGAKEAEGAVAFGPMVGGKISLGVRQNRLYWFKGAMRVVRFSPVALPEGELQRTK